MEENVLTLISTFLGAYGKHSGEWYSFNCPECAEEKGVKADNKYNLEVKIDLTVKGCGGYHCWRCKDTNGTRGTIVSLFKKYASKTVLDEFKQIVNDYREARKYELFDGSGDIPDEFLEDNEFYLPDGFKPIRKNDNNAVEAIEYLSKRGINNKIIEKYNIGYIGNDEKINFSFRNRIIIPSYDSFDGLNYWVGRDYTGKNKVRYKNPKAEKTKFIFNEGKINWYEPITLVEGPFDHIVVPNSIPLLGKSLSEDYLLYKMLVKRSRSFVYIFLDDDALINAKKIYKLLESSDLNGRVRIIECPDGYDASLIYEKYGVKGIISLLTRAKRLSDYELATLC
jgi:hypothetical protein